MSKPTAPPPGFMPPADSPPTYNQAVGGGVDPHAPYYPQPPAVGFQGMGYGAPAPPPVAAGFSPPGSGVAYGAGSYTAVGYVTPHATPVVPVVTTVVPPGPNPTHMICPHCHAEIESTVKTTPSAMAWISGALIALFGCWMGCCLIPCCIDECMDKEHTCPNCQAFLGKYRR